MTPPPVDDRLAIHEELDRARADLRDLVCAATAADLRRRTNGTSWTNGQMLWHMVFGYLIVWRLLPLVRTISRLPDRWSLGFAAVLDAATRPFHVVNYLGGCAGAFVFRGPRLVRLLDHTVDRLHGRLDDETDRALSVHMHFPLRWDPFFADEMTVADVYRYAGKHYDFHRTQLTLERRIPGSAV